MFYESIIRSMPARRVGKVQVLRLLWELVGKAIPFGWIVLMNAYRMELMELSGGVE